MEWDTCKEKTVQVITCIWYISACFGKVQINFFIVSENWRSNFWLKSVVTTTLSSTVICISSVLESLSTGSVCCMITVNSWFHSYLQPWCIAWLLLISHLLFWPPWAALLHDTSWSVSSFIPWLLISLWLYISLIPLHQKVFLVLCCRAQHGCLGA